MNRMITPIVCQHCEQDWKHGACGDCSMTRKQLNACIDLQQQLQQAHREGWEQCKMECIQECADAADDNLTAGMVKHAIAAMEYGG